MILLEDLIKEEETKVANYTKLISEFDLKGANIAKETFMNKLEYHLSLLFYLKNKGE